MGPTGTNQSKEQVSAILMNATEVGALLLLDKDIRMYSYMNPVTKNDRISFTEIE